MMGGKIGVIVAIQADSAGVANDAGVQSLADELHALDLQRRVALPEYQLGRAAADVDHQPPLLALGQQVRDTAIRMCKQPM